MRTKYITTPIYYVNDLPHIGHYYTSIAADIALRHALLAGFDCKMMTGTDEHGQKVQKSSEKLGENTMHFCTRISNEFRKMTVLSNCACAYEKFDLSNFHKLSESMNQFKAETDVLFESGYNFIRTSDGRSKDGSINKDSLESGRHIKTVLRFWQRLEENGWIYKGKYSGWYAVRDEAFYGEDEIVDGKAPSGAEVEWREEECYFFKLSAFQKILLGVYRHNPEIVAPYEKFTEVLSFVAGKRIADAKNYEFEEGALKDLCISRPNLTWGIPVPGDERQTIYVWLDALTNYISALGYPNGDYRKYWQDVVHIVGKDILRFHAVYWPAFLLASEIKTDAIDLSLGLDDIYEVTKNHLHCLPKQIFAHGWWMNDGQKISKSLGNVIKPQDEIDFIMSFGVDYDTALDYFRYFLFRSVHFGNDGNYSRKDLVETINADLANNIGNLVQRTFSMVKKYTSSSIRFDIENNRFDIENNTKEIESAIVMYEKMDFCGAIKAALSIASRANEDIEKATPWNMAKEGRVDELSKLLSGITYEIFTIAKILQPIVPSIALKILHILGLSASLYSDHLPNEIKIEEISGVCPRLSEK